MTRDVYKTFQERIPKNSWGFEVSNPNKYKDGIPRSFSFEYLHIVPEYFSMLATHNDMDNEDLNPIITRHNFKFEIKFKNNFYASNLFEYNIPSGEGSLLMLLESLNKVSESARANSMQYPPIVFDWVDEYLMGYKNIKKQNIRKYIEESKNVLYKLDEEEDEPKSTYDPSTHENVLPSSARAMPNVNNYLFPTEPGAIEYSRVRLIIAPNTRISFPNEYLLLALGFIHYGKRGPQNRIHIENKNPDKCLELVADLSPPEDLQVVIERASKLYIAVTQPHVIFSKTLTTTKYKEKKPELLLADLEGFLKQISTDCYIPFKVSFAGNKFTFTLMNDSFIETKMILPVSLQEGCGFANTEVTATNKVSSEIKPIQMETEKYVGLSKILTYDTCHVIVALANVPAISSYGHQEQIMAALVPKDEMLKMIKEVQPKVILPENDANLQFKIYRQSEAGKMIQLGWPIDCYVFGVLVGKPING